jgi:hypothetical protein
MQKYLSVCLFVCVWVGVGVRACVHVGWHVYTLRSESRCALTKCVGSDVHEHLDMPEPELNWIKQLHTLPILHFNHCLTTEYSETTTHFNSNFDTDNQIYVP